MILAAGLAGGTAFYGSVFHEEPLAKGELYAALMQASEGGEDYLTEIFTPFVAADAPLEDSVPPLLANGFRCDLRPSNVEGSTKIAPSAADLTAHTTSIHPTLNANMPRPSDDRGENPRARQRKEVQKIRVDQMRLENAKGRDHLTCHQTGQGHAFDHSRGCRTCTQVYSPQAGGRALILASPAPLQAFAKLEAQCSMQGGSELSTDFNGIGVRRFILTGAPFLYSATNTVR